MKISKADAIAHPAKWFDAGTDIRATHKYSAGIDIKFAGGERVDIVEFFAE